MAFVRGVATGFVAAAAMTWNYRCHQATAASSTATPAAASHHHHNHNHQPTTMAAAIATRPVRLLTPPILDEDHISASVPCVRPSRNGGLRMAVERVSSSSSSSSTSNVDVSAAAVAEERRSIYHNYGHGGSGWTLGPGSVDHVLSLFERDAVPQTAPIAVVGAGVIGLFTAWGLTRRGYRDITIIAEKDQDLTSHKAAGLMGIFALPGVADPHMLHAGIRSFQFYDQLRQGLVPELTSGVRDALVRQISLYVPKVDVPDTAPFVSHGLMKPASEVDVAFRPNGTLRRVAVHDDALFLKVTDMMDALETRLELDGIVKRESRRLSNLTTDIDANIKHVFNCSGVGSKELAKDDAVYGAGGHLVQLIDQPKGTEEYIFDLPGERVTDPRTGRTYDRCLYFFPKNGGLLGGTVIPGMGEYDLFDAAEFDRIVADAKDFFYS